MKVKEICEHFLARAQWVDRAKTVDRVIAGNPEEDVDRCLVTWMPSFQALREMVRRNVTFMICHEPTFWNHREDWPKDDSLSREKLQFIQANRLIILRNHDCWDRWPETGIPWAWAKFLGLGDKPAQIGAGGCQHRYDIAPIALDAFAGRIAERCASLGEPMVQVTGNAGAKVSRIGIGAGCGCSLVTYQEMGCDCSVVCDDGSCYWSGIQRAEDMGLPVIRVNHGTSEEPGMVTLTEYINANLPGMRAEHLPHGSTFRLVGAAKLSSPHLPAALQ